MVGSALELVGNGVLLGRGTAVAAASGVGVGVAGMVVAMGVADGDKGDTAVANSPGASADPPVATGCGCDPTTNSCPMVSKLSAVNPLRA